MGLWLVSQWAVPALLHSATAVRHKPFSGVIINFKTKAFDWLLSDSYMSLVISELVTPYKLITCMPADESESCGLPSLVRREPFFCPWSIFYRKLSVTRLAVLPLVGHEQPFLLPGCGTWCQGSFDFCLNQSTCLEICSISPLVWFIFARGKNEAKRMITKIRLRTCRADWLAVPVVGLRLQTHEEDPLVYEEHLFYLRSGHKSLGKLLAATDAAHLDPSIQVAYRMGCLWTPIYASVYYSLTH